MDSFQQPAFCFSIPTNDFDPNQVPIDGEQYLQSVIYERNKCPSVVVKPLSTHSQSKEPKKRSLIWDQYIESDVDDTTPRSLLPTSEWLQIQSQMFQKLHDRITMIRENFVPDYEKADLPKDNAELPWLEYAKVNKPQLPNMLHIQQRDLEQIIEYQSNWLQDDIAWYMENKHWFPQWVYSSLACLRLPCEPNLLNSLRTIAKTCIRLRNQLEFNETFDNVAPLSVIICIVSRNFDQSDLCGRSQ